MSLSSKRYMHERVVIVNNVEIINLCQVSASCQWYCMSLHIFELNAILLLNLSCSRVIIE